MISNALSLIILSRYIRKAAAMDEDRETPMELYVVNKSDGKSLQFISNLCDDHNSKQVLHYNGVQCLFIDWSIAS